MLNISIKNQINSMSIILFTFYREEIMTLRILNRDLVRRNMIEKIGMLLDYQNMRDELVKEYEMYRSVSNYLINYIYCNFLF